VPTEAPDELLSYCLVGKPVLIAAMEGLDVVINLGSAKRGFLPIQVATTAEKNTFATIDALIAAGADIKLKDKLGMTALHTASDKSKEGSGVMAKLLALPGGTEAMDMVDEDGCTALHYAAFSGRTDTVTALLRAGANKDLVNADGNTPLAEAEAKGHAKVVDLITNGPGEEGADAVEEA